MRILLFFLVFILTAVVVFWVATHKESAPVSKIDAQFTTPMQGQSSNGGNTASIRQNKERSPLLDKWDKEWATPEGRARMKKYAPSVYQTYFLKENFPDPFDN